MIADSIIPLAIAHKSTHAQNSTSTKIIQGRLAMKNGTLTPLFETTDLNGWQIYKHNVFYTMSPSISPLPHHTAVFEVKRTEDAPYKFYSIAVIYQDELPMRGVRFAAYTQRVKNTNRLYFFANPSFGIYPTFTKNIDSLPGKWTLLKIRTYVMRKTPVSFLCNKTSLMCIPIFTSIGTSITDCVKQCRSNTLLVKSKPLIKPASSLIPIFILMCILVLITIALYTRFK